MFFFVTISLLPFLGTFIYLIRALWVVFTLFICIVLYRSYAANSVQKKAAKDGSKEGGERRTERGEGRGRVRGDECEEDVDNRYRERNRVKAE